jgi:hypothetical protein
MDSAKAKAAAIARKETNVTKGKKPLSQSVRDKIAALGIDTK